MTDFTSKQTSQQTHEEALRRLCAAIPTADQEAAAAARVRLDTLTKPRDSLGQLEALLLRLAASTGAVCPGLEQRAILLAAADHGVAAEGVSAYPQAVTAQMVLNFLTGGAAINALAQAAGARILLVDAGVASDLPDNPALRRLNIRRGSGNIAREPAMQPHEATGALLAGAALLEEEATRSLDVLALGEMGIANTTPAAALTSAFTGAGPEQTVGRGTGIDDATLQHKRAIVAQALQRLPAPAASSDALTLLRELGGLEIAVMAGAMLAAATRRIPVLLDGYITTSAALVAAALAPNLRTHLFAAHCSAEPGHALALAHLGLTTEAGAGPLLQLDLRLGEGSGAALALPLLTSATRLMRDMATFEQAGVSNRDEA
jgi:nicotinate-nucleotide--dimethylbenzimidazole phosphoribosyltransferase